MCIPTASMSQTGAAAAAAAAAVLDELDVVAGAEAESDDGLDECTLETSPSDLLFYIRHLRGRLERRNAILNAIRKAYHRDVVVVKEHLYRMQKEVREAVEEEEDPLPTVPSIDLRPALKLFAPEECELRTKPCHACGGRLEIVHRDSARIERLRKSCQNYQTLEQKLRMQLIETERRAYLDRQELEMALNRNRDDRDVFEAKVNKLKCWIVGYDEAKKACAEMQSVIGQLETEKVGIQSALERTQTQLLAAKVQWNKSKKAKEDIADEMALSEETHEKLTSQFQSESNTLASHVWMLQGQLNDLANQRESLSLELVDCKKELCISQKDLEKALEDISTLHASMDSMREDHICIQDELLAKQTDMTKILQRQENDIEKKKRDRDLFRQNVQDSTCTLQSIRMGEHLPQNAMPREDNANGTYLHDNNNDDDAVFQLLNNEISSLNAKVLSLRNFASCYARCVYDQCSAQEAELLRGGHELEFTNSSRCDAVRVVMEHLDSQDDKGSEGEGDNIDWDALLNDEVDKRHVLSQLSNRMQMGLYSLKVAAEKQRLMHDAEIRLIRKEHVALLNTINTKHSDEISVLQKNLDSLSENCDQTKKNLAESVATTMNMSIELESTKRDAVNLEEQRNTAKSCVFGLEEKIRTGEDEQEKLKMINSELSDTILRQQADLGATESALQDRDAIIAQLERLLEKTTGKYAAMVEKERYRLDTNANVAIQAQPQVMSASHQVDLYIPPRLRSRPLRKDGNTGEYILSRVETERLPLKCHLEHIS